MECYFREQIDDFIHRKPIM